MLGRTIRHAVLSPIRRTIGAVGLLGAVVVLGVPIVAVLAVLGVAMDGIGLSTGVQEAVGIVVGFGLLAVVMGTVGYYLIDW